MTGTFHEPKSLFHKVQKTLMLETDVPETLNEMIKSVRKMGRCGVIAAYAGYANGFAIDGKGSEAYWKRTRCVLTEF